MIELHEDMTDEDITKLMLKHGPAWYFNEIPNERFACLVDWNKLNGWNWCLLLKHKPQFSDYCDWSKLDDIDWTYLLQHRPQFKTKKHKAKFKKLPYD